MSTVKTATKATTGKAKKTSVKIAKSRAKNTAKTVVTKKITPKATPSKNIKGSIVAKKKNISEQRDKSKWKTIHIFGYGETIVTGPDRSKRALNKDLKMLGQLFNFLSRKQKNKVIVSLDNMRAITIFNGIMLDFYPRNSSIGERFNWDEIDVKVIEKLAEELNNKAKNENNAAFSDAFFITKNNNEKEKVKKNKPIARKPKNN